MSSPPPSYTVHPSLNPFLVPVPEFLSSNPSIHDLITGALVTNPRGEILLLRRAAHDSWPLLWEVPGGCVDPTDANLVAAAARELWEESALRAKRVLCAVHMAPAAVLAGAKEEDRVRESASMLGDVVTFQVGEVTWGKLTVWVEVEAWKGVRIRDDEHAEWAWVSEEEARAERFKDGRSIDFVSDGVKRSVLEGYRLFKEDRHKYEDESDEKGEVRA